MFSRDWEVMLAIKFELWFYYAKYLPRLTALDDPIEDIIGYPRYVVSEELAWDDLFCCGRRCFIVRPIVSLL
jgi:hypothetical protein